MYLRTAAAAILGSGAQLAYKGSVNLNESGGQIHKNYNGWIQNLERGINARVSALN
jgi:hypothetical protein